MMAPPGYPNSTSTPCSSSSRQRSWAPERSSVIDGRASSHAPTLGRIVGGRLEPFGVALLVERMDQGPGTGFHDVGRSALATQRLPADPALQKDLTHRIASRSDGPERQGDHLHRALEDFADRAEGSGNRSIPFALGRAFTGPGTGHF